MEIKKVLLIGGSGFVGGHLAALLSERGMRVTVPARRRDKAKRLFVLPRVSVVQADANDPDTLRALMDGVDAVINLVGILHDTSSGAPYGKRFAAAHVELPQKIIAAMKQAGVRRLVHMSALKAASDAPSAYLRSKAAGEAVVLAAANELDVTVFRPSVMFGVGDVFLNTFATLLRCLPVLPLAGADARFQPVHVGDVVNAFADSLDNPATFGQVYELGGPRIYTLRALVDYVGALTGHRRPIIALPGALASVQASLLGLLPKPPMTPDNLRSMQVDSIVDGQHVYPGWKPQPLEAVAPAYLSAMQARRRFDGYRAHAGRRDE
ncbi:complex I NDUFA9 subunit family protein [Propionivibrio limicola]|uniref:complex I NDUFA9 subunit family protein n=1 Tax=Propionivibrio limicola TaxID=167645 RepID=UPI0012912FA6|nr:complex I NDUFA9 subunit family protein [Propionivibrio limicola]